MKYIIIFFLFISNPSYAGDINNEIEKMLLITDMPSVYDQTVQKLLDAQLQSEPSMVPYRDIFYKFLTKYMGFESIKLDLIKLYSQNFTVEDIKTLNHFYSTATGKKAMKLFPTITAQAGELGKQRMMDNIGQLRKMIEDEDARIKNK